MAILDALTALNQSLDTLEAAAAEQAQKSKLKAKQQDLFNDSQPSLNPAIIAQKLDVTIERVEQLLAEG